MSYRFGISDARDGCYGAAACLSYWVFRCRDRQKTPAMGTKTWTFLESSIQNSAEVATTIEDYLQSLSSQLVANLRPAELLWIVQPQEKIVRIDGEGNIQELVADQKLAIYSWKNIIESIAPEGYGEWDVLELCRTKASIIQVLVRLRFEMDRALNKETIDDAIDVKGYE